MPLAAERFIAQHHANATRTDRQRCNERLHPAAIDRVIAIQPLDSRLHERPTILRPHNQPGANLPQFDHVRHLHHPREDAEAGVRNVVDEAVARQTERMMHAARRRRLQIIAADRTVHQRPDERWINSRRCDRPPAALDADLSGPRPARIEPPFANPGHQFQSPLRQPQPLVRRRQSPLELVGGDHLFRQRVAYAFKIDAAVTHEGRVGGLVEVARIPRPRRIPHRTVPPTAGKGSVARERAAKRLATHTPLIPHSPARRYQLKPPHTPRNSTCPTPPSRQSSRQPSNRRARAISPRSSSRS